MRIKSVDFILENCEVITIDGKYIGDFLIDDVQTRISRIACNSISKMDIANTIAIEIHRDANKERHQFGCTGYKQKTFDRLVEWNDITSIEFELEEGNVEEGKIPRVEHYHYFVNWVGDNDEENDAQSTYISDNEDLYLVIAENKQIEDYFNDKLIDDDEYAYMHWDLLMDERWMQ